MILQLAKQALDSNKVWLFKYGEQYRDFVYIKDVVEANIKAIDGVSGIYNVGSGISRTFNDIIAILSTCLNRNIEVSYFDSPYRFYQNNTCADISGSKSSFGYQPMFTLEDGIREYIREIIRYTTNQWDSFYE